MSKVKVAVLVFTLIFSCLSAIIMELMVADASSNVTLTLKDFHPSEARGSHRITLITGDVVVVTDLPDGRRAISVIPADPKKPGQNFKAFTVGNDTYVIPSLVNMEKVDIEFFNIDLLIRDGYEALPHLPVIVEYSSDVNALTEQIKERRGEVTRIFSIVKALATKLPKEGIGELSKLLVNSQEVRKVWLDRKVRLNLNESVPLIGAPSAWSLGFNGSGIKIAILDTGIDSAHPDFYFPNGTSKIALAVDFTDDYTTSDLSLIHI